MNPLFSPFMFHPAQAAQNYQQVMRTERQPQFEQIKEIDEFTEGRLTFGESKHFN
jgi:hypothetical protein